LFENKAQANLVDAFIIKDLLLLWTVHESRGHDNSFPNDTRQVQELGTGAWVGKEAPHPPPTYGGLLFFDYHVNSLD